MLLKWMETKQFKYKSKYFDRNGYTCGVSHGLKERKWMKITIYISLFVHNNKI